MNRMREKAVLPPVPKVLIAYPDNRIKDSWEEDFEKWSFKVTDKIIFVNYSSIWKYETEAFDLIILDEIHATSEAQRASIQMLVDMNDYILGLSGTISRDTEEELAALGLQVIMKYSVEEAIKDGIIAPYKIYIHMVSLDNIIKEKNSKGKLITEKQKYANYTWVIENLKRSGQNFKFLALQRNRVLQSSISKMNYTKKLIDKHKDKKILVFTGLKKVAESLGIAYYHSTSEDKDVFENFKAGDINAIAVVNIGRAGVTFDQLEVIIINSFTGNEETTEQIIARALNRDIEDKTAEIHIVTSDEEPELKKLRKTLSSFDKNNVIWQ
jgi:superfamily II DNA or RNA helicase